MLRLLELDMVSLRFGGQRVLTDISFEAAEGQILGLIGPNGAGKTSIFNCISRTYRPDSGEIRVGGQPLGGLPPHKVARMGVARTFQNVDLLQRETVLDNVLLGSTVDMRSTLPEALFHLGRSRREELAARTAAFAILERLDLVSVAADRVAELPYAHQKLVDIARCLAARPRLMLLDEPVAGLHEQERLDIIRLLRNLRDHDGLTLVLVEHDVAFVRALADSMIALDFGRVIATGEPAVVLQDPRVLAAYLGVPAG